MQDSDRRQSGTLFIQVRDENALTLLLRTPEELIRSVPVGAPYLLDESHLAGQFVMAASMLVKAAVGRGISWMYANPILFLYRHAIELYLKAIIPPSKPTHDLNQLAAALTKYMRDEYGVDIKGWITDTIQEFADIDPTSTRFRYVHDTSGQRMSSVEYEIDLKELQMRLDALFRLLWIIQSATGTKRDR